MIRKIKIGLFLLLCILIGNASVLAKEVNIYFYPNGGKVQTNDFKESSYGYISYKDTYFYAEYKGNNNIKHINSINGKTFTVSKGGTSLVKGREWYVKSYYNDQIYFLSESKTYKIDDIFAAIEEDGAFSTLDLYAHWNNDVKSGTDIKSVGTTTSSPSPSPSTTPTTLSITPSKKSIKKGESVTLKTTFKPTKNKETVTWSSSNKNVATVNSNGKVTGVGKGTATITGKTSSGLKDTVSITVTESEKVHYVHVVYNVNGGSLNPAHGSDISLNGKTILCSGSNTCTKIANNDSTSGNGLRDINNSNQINLVRDGYYVDTAKAWNTKANGSGTSFSQAKVYKASEFCNASKKDCTVTLYANWKKKNNSTYRIALIGNSKTRYGSSKYPNSNISDVFQKILSTMGKKADVSVIVKGGSTISYKANNTPYKTEIANGTYDYVVLQEKTAVAEDDVALFQRGSQEVYNLLKKKDAKIFVRTAWPRKDSDFDNNVSKMTDNASTVASSLNGTVINDARAFQAARAEGIEMHIPDNNHPTAEGAYLAAACIYKYIYNENATKITYYHSINKTTAKTLLKIADNYC